MRYSLAVLSALAVSTIALAGCTKANEASNPGAASGSSAASSSFDKDAAAREIRRGDSLWLRTMRGESKNLDSLGSLYTSDAVSMQEGAPAAKGRDAIMAGLQEFMKLHPRDLQFQFGEVKFSDDGTLAYASGSYSGTIDGPGGKPVKATGNYLTVYRNDGGVWKAAADMSNSNAQ